MIKLNFDVKKHILPNGLEVITIKKNTQIASINLAIKVGALYENKNEKGISHFIEHMVFKGTNKRSFQQLNDELEALGGEYNAYTDYSSTVYTINCLEEELFNGVELLGDMITSSVFLQEEIEKERGVILAEIRTSKDSVEDLSFKRVNEIAFKHSGLRYDVAGIESNVKRYNHDNLIKFYRKYYVPNNSLITIASSLDHDVAVKKIADIFSGWKRGKDVSLKVNDEKNIFKKETTIKENIELSTIVYLFTFYDLPQQDELALRILNHRLGESSNSLLFREIRENKGLAYDIYSHLDVTNHVKTLYIYTAVDEEDIEEALKAIDETLDGIKREEIKIGEKDLEIMKKVHKTAVISTLEDSMELCSYIMNQTLENENIYEFLDDMSRLNNINKEKIYEVANKVIKNPTIHILKS